MLKKCMLTLLAITYFGISASKNIAPGELTKSPPTFRIEEITLASKNEEPRTLERAVKKKEEPYLLMDKSSQTLSLITSEGTEEYPAIHGDNYGGKINRGDKRTPEGEYFICTSNPKSKWNYFYGLNYPNERDGKKALKKGIISKKQYDAIARAERLRICPPWDTPLGGAIGIHGTRKDCILCEEAITYSNYLRLLPFETHYNWTYGCIGLRNEDFSAIRKKIKGIGTRIVIQE